MVNLFPIQFLSLFAYLILRLVVGGILLALGRSQLRSFALIAPQIRFPLLPHGAFVLTLIILTELIAGTLFIIGLFTQIAALFCIALSVKLLVWHNRFPIGSIPPRLVYVLLLGASLSLFITGAGFLAFDLPI